MGCIAGTLIAVSCHRIVLLGHRSLPASWGLYWSSREFAFVGRAFVIGLPSAILDIVGGALLFWMTYARPDQDRSLYRAFFWVIWLPLAYPTSRLSLVLPGTATDDRVTFAESWRMSAGNGWRLTITLLTAPLLLTGLSIASRSLLPEGQTALVAPRAFLFCVLGVFEIAILSVAFRMLRSPAVQQEVATDDAAQGSS
jgi:hypothetical protein